MKNLFTLLLLTITTLSFSQKVDKFEITADNVKGFMVHEYKGKTANEIYVAVKKWAQYNIYKATTAIHSDVENEYLAFNINGVGELKLNNKSHWTYRMDLNVEVRIRDNKARVDLVIKDMPGDKPFNGLKIKGSLMEGAIFKSNGKFRNAYSKEKIKIENLLTEFANELFNSANGAVDYKKDDW